MSTVKKFEDLEIWKLARILCRDINNVAVNTGLKSDYRLYSQIDGSSGSVMDNIAERFERNGNKEFIQFLSISKASCGETRSQLYRVLDKNYINTETFDKLHNQTIVLGKMIGRFINYLKKSELKGSKYKTV